MSSHLITPQRRSVTTVSTAEFPKTAPDILTMADAP
jgi:hypothetical protein